MTKLREAVLLEMRLRGFSPRTHESYIYALEQLAKFYWLPLEILSCNQVQAFLDHLITVRKLAWATVNVYFSAYRFLYEQVLKRQSHEFSIPRRGRSGKRPGVLSLKEVKQLINSSRNIKHRALLTMTYGSGLRVSEVIKIKPKHIDRDRMMLLVEDGKGHKDRYTILSHKALKMLEEHWRINKPVEYFFFGRDRHAPMSVGTAQSIYYQAIKRSGVRHVGGIHVLRHCFATHLMENGTDIYTIKKWMGHRSLVTTGRYMHVTMEHLLKVKSPLDRLHKII
jgi:site-specific recombinase XerD